MWSILFGPNIFIRFFPAPLLLPHYTIDNAAIYHPPRSRSRMRRSSSLGICSDCVLCLASYPLSPIPVWFWHPLVLWVVIFMCHRPCNKFGIVIQQRTPPTTISILPTIHVATRPLAVAGNHRTIVIIMIRGSSREPVLVILCSASVLDRLGTE